MSAVAQYLMVALPIAAAAAYLICTAAHVLRDRRGRARRDSSYHTDVTSQDEIHEFRHE